MLAGSVKNELLGTYKSLTLPQLCEVRLRPAGGGCKRKKHDKAVKKTGSRQLMRNVQNTQIEDVLRKW
jgi:hypothetical protein